MIACRICVAKHGLRLEPRPSYVFDTEEEQFAHLELVHHTPVSREGETKKAATIRFLAEHPEAKDCKECLENGAAWTKL